MRVRSNTQSVAAGLGVLGLVLCGCGDKSTPATPATPAASTEAAAPVTPSMAAPTQPVPLPTTPAPAEMATAPTTDAPTELPPLFEQLEKAYYKGAYLALFDGMSNVPQWMREGGTASPGRAVMIGSGAYELYSHCKPHDCGDTMMYVLFRMDTYRVRAWALAMENGKSQFFGDPEAEIAAALKNAACEDHKRVGEAC